MTVLPWILGCAVVCTGISCLILLNQRNSPKLKHVHMDVSENGCKNIGYAIINYALRRLVVTSEKNGNRYCVLFFVNMQIIF